MIFFFSHTHGQAKLLINARLSEQALMRQRIMNKKSCYMLHLETAFSLPARLT